MEVSAAISGDQLRNIVERIEHVEHEIQELADARKEIYLEAKGNGFDMKILREVIRLRKQDPDERDEHESLVEVYFQAIKGGAATAEAKVPNGNGRARHGPRVASLS